MRWLIGIQYWEQEVVNPISRVEHKFCLLNELPADSLHCFGFDAISVCTEAAFYIHQSDHFLIFISFHEEPTNLGTFVSFCFGP